MAKFNKELFVKLLSEFLASMLVLFVGCASPTLLTLKNNNKDDPDFAGYFGQSCIVSTNPLGRILDTNVYIADPLVYSMAWGGAVLAATQIFRIISGAHINPCVTVAAMIVQNIKIVDGFLYILMQLLGSAVGFFLSYVLFKSSGNMENFFCLTAVTVEPWWKSFLIEFFLTGAWVFAMCASWHEANESLMESISLRIGLTVAATTMAGSVFTGASMNPFRTVWGVIIGGYYKHCYVYFIMPLVAGALIGVCWRFIYKLGEKKSGGGGE